MDYLEYLNHSILSLLCLKENIPKLFNLSSYNKFFRPEIILVALLWTPSSIFASFTSIGVQNCMQYSKCDLTYDLHSFEITSEDSYNTLFIVPNIE